MEKLFNFPDRSIAYNPFNQGPEDFQSKIVMVQSAGKINSCHKYSLNLSEECWNKIYSNKDFDDQYDTCIRIGNCLVCLD